MIINLTPHTITIAAPKTTIIVKPSGIITRAQQKHTLVKTIDNIPIYKTTFGKVQDLPAPQPNTIYIVSSIVAIAIKAQHPDRKDIFIPVDFLRDNNGTIIACQALARV